MTCGACLPRFAIVLARYRRSVSTASHCVLLVAAGGVPAPDAQDAGARRPAERRRRGARRGSSRPRAEFLRDGGRRGEFQRDRRGVPRRSDRAVGPALRRHRGGQGAQVRRGRRSSSRSVDRRRTPTGPHRARASCSSASRRTTGRRARRARTLLEQGREGGRERRRAHRVSRGGRVRDRGGRRPLASLARVRPAVRARHADRARADRRARRGGRRRARPQATLERAVRSSSPTARARRSPPSAAGSRSSPTSAGDAPRAAQMRENMVPARAAVGLPRTITETEVGRHRDGQRRCRASSARWCRSAARRESRRRSRGRGPRARRRRTGWQGRRRDRDARGRSTRRRRPKPSRSSRRQNVIAIVGPIDGASVDARRARREPRRAADLAGDQRRAAHDRAVRVPHPPLAGCPRTRTRAARARRGRQDVRRARTRDRLRHAASRRRSSTRSARAAARSSRRSRIRTTTKSFADRTSKLKRQLGRACSSPTRPKLLG